jgi:hypothetical protein
MKKILLRTSLLAIVAVGFTACKLDNYDPPSSTLTGKVVDRNGNAIGVQGARGNVSLQLWQPSYPLHADAITVYVAQDGSFSALLFDGDYVLKMRGLGPWEQNAADSLAIKVSGGKAVTFPVSPYYTIGGVSYSLSGTTLSATFTVTEVTQGRDIDEIALMVNNTQFVDFDGGDHVAKQSVADDDRVAKTHTVSIDLADAMAATSNRKLYARVGLRISGIGQGLYDTGVYTVK